MIDSHFVTFLKLLWISIHDQSPKVTNGGKAQYEDSPVHPTADEEGDDHEQRGHRVHLRSQQLRGQRQLGQASRSFVGVLKLKILQEAKSAGKRDIGSFSPREVIKKSTKNEYQGQSTSSWVFFLICWLPSNNVSTNIFIEINVKFKAKPQQHFGKCWW